MGTRKRDRLTTEASFYISLTDFLILLFRITDAVNEEADRRRSMNFLQHLTETGEG